MVALMRENASLTSQQYYVFIIQNSMKKDLLIFCFALYIGGINGQIINSILFTSNWSGLITDVTPVMTVVFINYNCPVRYTPQFVTPGLSLLSNISSMTAEYNRLNSATIDYGVGDANAFVNYILPPSSSNAYQITDLYPTDQQLVKLVIQIIKVMFNPLIPPSNILVILSMKNNLNNLNVNNYENIINLFNQQNYSNIIYLDYTSADDVVTQLRLNPFYNIISLLSDPSDNRDLIQKVYMANLMIWKYKWLIVNLLGEYTLLQSATYGSGVLSNNVTVITFADPVTKSTGRTSLLTDALKLIRTSKCDNIIQTSLYPVISGTYKISPIVRTEFKYLIFTNPGNNATQGNYIIHDLLTGTITIPSAFNFVPFTMNISNSLTSLKARVFRIGFVNYPPFATKNETDYTGFIIKILRDILNENNISYTFIDMTDSFTGNLNTSNLMYSNLLGMVQNGIVDTLTVPYIISVDRHKYFDFATNFLSGNISVLIKFKTLTDINALINYVIPLDWTVWVTFLGSALGIAFALAISDYLFPDKFARYKILMSLFFSFSSLTHGAYFDPPRKLGGRIIMSFWWLFCLLVVIIWICNYAAFQSVSKTQLTTFYSLLNQKLYRFGTLNDDLVFNFLSKNNDTNAQSMLQLMQEDTLNGTVPDLNSALQLVMNDNYSFIYENSVVMYFKNQYCLDMFGNWMSFEYGLVLPKNSEKTMILTSELTKRRGNGMIDNLILQYWPTTKNACVSTSILNSIPTQLQFILPNYFDGSFDLFFMIGVFTITIVGGVCCLILAMFERLIRYILQKQIERRNRYEYDNTLNQLTQF